MPATICRVNTILYFFIREGYFFYMITSAQIRASRGLLKWTQAMLAQRAQLSVVTLNMVESDSVDPRASTLRAIEAALAKAGIELLGEDGGGLGVRFRAPRPADA